MKHSYYKLFAFGTVFHLIKSYDIQMLGKEISKSLNEAEEYLSVAY